MLPDAIICWLEENVKRICCDKTHPIKRCTERTEVVHQRLGGNLSKRKKLRFALSKDSFSDFNTEQSTIFFIYMENINFTKTLIFQRMISKLVMMSGILIGEFH
jgi:hypothetical protein